MWPCSVVQFTSSKNSTKTRMKPAIENSICKRLSHASLTKNLYFSSAASVDTFRKMTELSGILMGTQLLFALI